jgi:hypothetical protein
VVAALALTGAALFILTGLALAVRLMRIGNLDAMALAEKLAVPCPSSAADWPELRIRAVVPQPGQPSVALLLVGWPGHHGLQATLLVRLDGADQRSLPLLSRWCADRSAISPRRCQATELEFRRRQSLERVRVRVLAEDAASASLPAHP